MEAEVEKYTKMIESELWPELCNFYHLRVDYNHPSWILKLFLQYVNKDILNASIIDSGIWLLRKLKMDCRFSIPVDHTLSKLILAKYNKVNNVVKHCGLALLNTAMRSGLYGGGLQKLKNILGEEDYRFAINTAPLLLSHWPDSILAKSKLSSNKQELIDYITIVGINAINSVSKDFEEGVMQRLKFKFNINFRSSFVGRKFANTKDEKVLLLLINKIIRMVEPTCENLLK